jgi:hypothetical protein
MSRTMSKTEILTAVVDFFQKTGEGLKTSADIALKLAKVAVEVMDAMQPGQGRNRTAGHAPAGNNRNSVKTPERKLIFSSPLLGFDSLVYKVVEEPCTHLLRYAFFAIEHH